MRENLLVSELQTISLDKPVTPIYVPVESKRELFSTEAPDLVEF